MVAATKMRRAQMQAINGRPYNTSLQSSLLRLLPKVQIQSHALLSSNESDNKAFLLLSTDKSLCGALNTNLFRLILGSHLEGGNAMPAGRQVNFYTVGKKGRSFVVKSGKNLIADFENPEKTTFRQAVQISRLLMEGFKNGEIGEVFVLYPNFISTLKQEPKISKILPVSYEDLIQNMEVEENSNQEFIFEPGILELLDSLLIHFVQMRIYQSLLETKASEHSARMMAMQNATDNAKELVEDLNLTYNQTRQGAITNELLEITSAQLALG